MDLHCFMHIHGHSRLSTMWYIIPRHKLVAGYHVFTLAVRVSVRPSVRSLYVRPSALRFRSIAKVFINGFHSNFAGICTNNVSLGSVNGHISIIYHIVMALVNVQKMIFGL